MLASSIVALSAPWQKAGERLIRIASQGRGAIEPRVFLECRLHRLCRSESPTQLVCHMCRVAWMGKEDVGNASLAVLCFSSQRVGFVHIVAQEAKRKQNEEKAVKNIMQVYHGCGRGGRGRFEHGVESAQPWAEAGGQPTPVGLASKRHLLGFRG